MDCPGKGVGENRSRMRLRRIVLRAYLRGMAM